MNLPINLKSLLVLFLICSLTCAMACNGEGDGGEERVIHVLPQEELFEESGHADATAEPFNHWDEDVPPLIPTMCAKCHNTEGFLDFLGITGPTVRMVDNPVLIDPEADNALDCETCHNEKTFTWDTVVFPSGVSVDDLGRWSFCMECHQGRESTVSVNVAIAEAAPEGPDVVDPDLAFINSHYFVAAATQYGGVAMGGYQYDDNIYFPKYSMAEQADVCIECHNPHSLEINIELCQQCHPGVETEMDLFNIRTPDSVPDFDGDGNTTEGIYYEIQGLQQLLEEQIEAYAEQVIGTCIIYDPDTFPYFFIDTNCNGEIDAGENVFSNAYNMWTERLVKATYNLQFTTKDPGNFAHNPDYTIELLYDSIEDLSMAPAFAAPVNPMDLARNELNHFDITAEPFRHWDEDGEVPAVCSRCHTPQGYVFYINHLFVPLEPQPIPYGLTCDTCHLGIDYAFGAPRRFVETIVFPSGLFYDNDPENPNDAFICISCHQGRESTVSVNTAVAGIGEDIVDASLGFINVHYLPAGATIYGNGAEVAYQYSGQTYAGKFDHFTPSAAECPYCHQINEEVHTFEPVLKTPPETNIACVTCHTEVVDDLIETIRRDRPIDYNGNGNNTEPLEDEMATIADALYAGIRAYAAGTIGISIAYDGETYPYWFVDTNDNGVVDIDEATAYPSWTPRLVKATYNYQYYQKEPCAWAHNTNYIAQILIDSTADIGGDVSGFNRPVTP
jgi:hypothetical protein